jgi:hypothetical protein
MKNPVQKRRKTQPKKKRQNVANKKRVRNASGRKTMELAIQAAIALSILGGIGITLSTYFHKANLIVWTTYATVIFVLLVPALYWQKHVWETAPKPHPEPSIRGLLLPANDPTPPNPCGDTPPNNIAIYFGNSAALSAWPNPILVKVNDENLLSFEQTSDGLYLNALLRSPAGEEVARITRNVIRVTPTSGYYVERPDPHTLIILDPEDKKALYVRYLNPKAIKILGTFRDKNNNPQAIIEDNKQTISGTQFNGFCFDMRNAGVLFHIVG